MQLFTHLLSSYLQGMGDFFSALIRQARMGVAGNIRESALEILSDTHGRNRAKP